jgi:hypothetical protein
MISIIFSLAATRMESENHLGRIKLHGRNLYIGKDFSRLDENNPLRFFLNTRNEWRFSL